MAAGQASQAQGALQEANVAYSERYVIATNDMEIETISLNPGELATAGFALFNGYIPSVLTSVLQFRKVRLLNIRKVRR